MCVLCVKFVSFSLLTLLVVCVRVCVCVCVCVCLCVCVRVSVCVCCVFWGCGEWALFPSHFITLIFPPYRKTGVISRSICKLYSLGYFFDFSNFPFSDLLCWVFLYSLKHGSSTLPSCVPFFFFFLSGVICQKENQQKSSCVSQPNRSVELLLSDSGSKIGL